MATDQTPENPPNQTPQPQPPASSPPVAEQPPVLVVAQPGATPPDPGPDSVDEHITNVLADLGYGPPKKKTEKQPDATDKTPAEPAPTPAPEPKPVEPATPPPQPSQDEPPPDAAKPPKTPRPKRESLDPETIRALARDAAHSVINERGVKPEPQPAPVAQPQDALSQLDQREQRRLTVLRQMEQEHPELYRGIADKTLRGTVAFKEYRTKWEVEHPDEEFDPDAEDHAQVAAKLLPTYDEDDYDDARSNLRAAERERVTQEQNLKQNAAKSVEERIKQRCAQAEMEMLKAVDEETANLLSKPETAKKFAEENKAEVRALQRGANRLKSGLTELERLMDPHLGYEPSRQNPLHNELGEFAADVERRMLTMPEEKQLDREGRRFVTSEQYAALNPVQRRRYWTVNLNMLSMLWTSQVGAETKVEIEEIREYSKTRGKSESQPATETPRKPEPKTPPPPAQGAAKPNPPTTASSSDAIKTADTSLKSPPDLVQTIVKGLF